MRTAVALPPPLPPAAAQARRPVDAQAGESTVDPRIALIVRAYNWPVAQTIDADGLVAGCACKRERQDGRAPAGDIRTGFVFWTRVDGCVSVRTWTARKRSPLAWIVARPW